MRNTNVLTFTLRERAYLSTKIFTPEELTAGQEPGQTLLVSVDPIGALLSPGIDVARDGQDTLAPAPYATALAVTLSRFRRFKYIGTRIGLRPAATTGQVDIAHISAPQGGSSNYVHPYDVSNMIHYRRWIGGNIDLPHLRIGSHIAHDGSTSLLWGTKQAMDLDLAWMSDPRFMHSNVSQGFDLFARPMRATVEAAPEGATSMWLYGQYTNAGQAGSFAETMLDPDRKPLGRTMLTGGHIVPDGWTHNPLSCFQYTSDYGRTTDGSPAHDVYHIIGIQPRAPWFSDYMNVGQFAGSALDALKLVKERYMNPVCILRLPPAYGTVMYFTMYIAHYFAVKEPYLTNTAYVAAHIDSITPHPIDEAEAGLVEVPRMRIQPSGIVVHQAVTPDPQSAAETGYTAEFGELMGMEYVGALKMQGTDEPTDGMNEMADAFAEFAEVEQELYSPSENIPQPEAVEPPEGGGVSGGEKEEQ